MSGPVKFFIPNATDDEMAAWVYEGIVAFTSGWVDKRHRIYRIQCGDYVAEVGKREPSTGEVVIAILRGADYKICTGNHGMVKGQPLLVGRHEVTGVTYFADSPHRSANRRTVMVG